MANTNKESRASQFRRNPRTLMLVQLALLTAIIFIFELTGIGFIPVPPLTLVIMMIPVIIGAVTMGKSAGAILGGMFGITSMMQCFGKNALGTFLFGLNPFFTIVTNVGVRVLVGFLTALTFRILKKHFKSKLWVYMATGLIGSLLNTLIYIGTLVLLFGSVPEVQEAFGNAGELVSLGSFFLIAMGVVIINAVVEAAVCAVIAGSAAKVIDQNIK